MPTFSEIQNCLSQKTVGIAGAGGLGSNCAAALARTGIGKLIIADFDVVSESNLNRQYYFYDQIGQKKVFALRENISRINPAVAVEVHTERVTSENILKFFEKCDVIVEAFDQADQKQMLIEFMLDKRPHTPVVAGSGMAGYGDSNSLRVEKIDNLYICGDGMSEVSVINPPLAPRVGIVSNMEANVVLEILLIELSDGDRD